MSTTTAIPVPSILELDASSRLLSAGFEGVEKISAGLRARAESEAAVDFAELGRLFLYLEHVETVHELTGRMIQEARERTVGLAYADEGGKTTWSLPAEDVAASTRLAADWARSFNHA